MALNCAMVVFWQNHRIGWGVFESGGFDYRSLKNKQDRAYGSPTLKSPTLPYMVGLSDNPTIYDKVDGNTLMNTCYGRSLM